MTKGLPTRDRLPSRKVQASLCVCLNLQGLAPLPHPPHPNRQSTTQKAMEPHLNRRGRGSWEYIELLPCSPTASTANYVRLGQPSIIYHWGRRRSLLLGLLVLLFHLPGLLRASFLTKSLGTINQVFVSPCCFVGRISCPMYQVVPTLLRTTPFMIT